MRRGLAAAALAAILAGVAGCGAYNEANNYKASIARNIQPGDWTRIDAPSNYPQIARACVGGDGIYIAQDNTSSVEVEPHDPACAK